VAAAVTSARKAIALQPTFGPAWVELTKLLQKSNRTDAAVAEARRLQADRPKDSVGWLLEGEIYASAKNWPAAVAAYRQAYARSAQPLIAGRIYLALLHEGKAAEAAAFATQWNREHPKDVSVLVLQAREAQARKDFPNALSLYRAALAIEPDNYILLNNYAWQLAQSNDPAAREYAERAYRVAPFTAGVLDTYGSVLVATGDVPRGLSMLRMATNLEPQDPELRLHLGKALAKGGDKAAARRELETIARTNPQSPLRNDAEKALAEL
jgi:Flp pilus assembly protein TadD